MRKIKIVTLFFIVLAGFGLTGADVEEEFSGFLSDYPDLEPVVDEFTDHLFIAPGTATRVGKYSAILIDQPEILISRESPYMGMKPDDMKELAEGLRQVIIEEVKDIYRIAEAPGPDVLYLRTAVTNLYLKKKRRPIVGYTPIGFVATTTKKALTRNITKKINLIEMGVELEVMDSETSEILVAVIMKRGFHKDKGQKAEPASWEDLDGVFQLFGKRLRCRLDNSRLPEAERVDCLTLD